MVIQVMMEVLEKEEEEEVRHQLWKLAENTHFSQYIISISLKVKITIVDS